MQGVDNGRFEFRRCLWQQTEYRLANRFGTGKVPGQTDNGIERTSLGSGPHQHLHQEQRTDYSPAAQTTQSAPDAKQNMRGPTADVLARKRRLKVTHGSLHALEEI